MKVDPARRRRVMQRSMKLGHCICDPRRPCPCPVFTEQGICSCAGEKPDPVPLAGVRLTQLVHNAGCASKIAPADLEAVLARLPKVNDPAVLSGIPAGDDAGVYRLTGDVTVVQTVDVMTPCVDDPETFGRICATNCLSDIYAMGGVPRTALSILCFPAETLDGRIMYHMMKGAMDVLAEAGVALIGGHSIKDEEIMLGFAITGTVPADTELRHDTAAVGDVLVLTKPLGTGVLAFCRQIGRDADMAPAERAMATLNRPAAEAAREVGVSACTDVTGFGLFGHLISMARHSGVTAQVFADRLPALPGAVEALRDDVVPGAIERNREYVAEDLSVADGVDEALVNLGFDAQTSGGLLLAVPASRLDALLAALRKRGVFAAIIGKIVEKSAGKIAVTLAGQSASAAPLQEILDAPPPRRAGAPDALPEESEAEPCCPEADHTHADGVSSAPDALRAFGALMRSVGAEGLLDERTKELIALALVAMSRCGPCLKAHLARATKMGISRQELDEAVWIAVAMGGAPVRMFYAEAMESLTGQGGACCK